MTTIKYKGFSIVARPYQLHRSKRWSVELEIRRNGGKQPFCLDESYRTEQEADARCTGVGRRIIDGKLPGWSVDHLRAGKGSATGYFLAAGIVLVGLGAALLLREADISKLPVRLSMPEIRLTPTQQQAGLGGAILLAGMTLIITGRRMRS